MDTLLVRRSVEVNWQDRVTVSPCTAFTSAGALTFMQDAGLEHKTEKRKEKKKGKKKK